MDGKPNGMQGLRSDPPHMLTSKLLLRKTFDLDIWFVTMTAGRYEWYTATRKVGRVVF
jgi:hypothetical protein